ncbi:MULTISPECIES: ornithine carbamoyltransferase [Pseudothermotoga]|jgi:ornithine carbamoyltransferase|uniref:Ornithine carbamoyltransferase n=1 Tax=Pseudothermotoga lettingae (strain ATCC BAA-301 / DSM 14385 / NBRC 107922 / TMO) TaxID=416591 RepID=OTC_PSELT|nr:MULTISPECIES: ornithine carbamoyltransferase [Pseudothermotoga]A8F7Z9.1 RecName: Full=Ornithine carbamoyltransferase; Short=OTCase [Pseudothermotoga lettingae TMO]ABV34283.1 ornithine carbamoyltransferase [Pseudothermotoga lettingae TMO]KUK20537.1 MAG: Ornithine carbamoyltransferase [Pseudothermotoga lettingae]MDI3495350.1 ornithine carbamoyltransferase [Pseudothermotoga sp.]MDK2884985.1 ornithine carbamoyltransferase [Pseudothermotoga sp.]GLI48772.1 ornithine carbamoyltransferase [Pseudot
MAINLTGRSLLTLLEYTPEEISFLLDLSAQVKRESRARIVHKRFAGKTLAMIFEKRSTRTRMAFETAFAEEGGHPIFLSIQDIQLGAKESIEDTARVLGRMVDAIMFRGYKQETVETLAKYSGVPVYNGLTDVYHPTQVLADLMTTQEVFGKLKGIKLVFMGDGRNNMANSLMIGCAKMGMHYVVCSPAELRPDENLMQTCLTIAKETDSKIEVIDDPEKAVDGADVIYTDVWASMGEESKQQERERLLRPYQVNEVLMRKTGKKDTIFLHCLPAVKGQEVTFDVIEGKQSRVWDEAENRKHTIKALMIATLL